MLRRLDQKYSNDPAGAKHAATNPLAALPKEMVPINAAVWADLSRILTNTRKFVYLP